MDPEESKKSGDESAGSEGSLLSETVQTLSKMIKDLEKQLARMLQVNEALEKDLEQERKKASKAERERALMKDQLQRAEEEVDSLEDLRAEIGQLGRSARGWPGPSRS